jgi:hypothetical protein
LRALVIEAFASCPFFLPRVEARGQGCGGQSVRAACQQTYERLHAHRQLNELALSGLMEWLVVLRPEHLSSFSKSDRMGSFSPCLAAGNCSSTEIGLNPQGRRMCQTEIVRHISPFAAARSALRLSRAASASDKGSALMGPGDDARVQSISRAANHTYGAEGTR